MKPSPNHPSVPTGARLAQSADVRARIVLAMLNMDRPTIRRIGKVIGRSPQVVHKNLHRLRAQGIVDWDDGRDGTLHLLVRPVPFG